MKFLSSSSNLFCSFLQQNALRDLFFKSKIKMVMLYSSLMLETSKKETQRSKSNYEEPKRSTICSTSSIYSSLHQKYKDTIQLPLTFYMKLNLSSKHLLFLSFQTVHHMQAGMILHHFFWFLFPPSSDPATK